MVSDEHVKNDIRRIEYIYSALYLYLLALRYNICRFGIC